MMKKKNLKMRKTKQKTKKVKMVKKQKNQRNTMKRSMKRYDVSFPFYTKSDATRKAVCWLSDQETSLASLMLRESCSERHYYISLPCCTALFVVNLSGCFRFLASRNVSCHNQYM